jgi:hypothetical protein
MGRPDGADAAGRLREALNALLGAAEAAVTPVGLVADEVLRQRAALRDTEHRPWPLPARPWLMGRGTPPLPWLSHFPELNVRTYVH